MTKRILVFGSKSKMVDVASIKDVYNHCEKEWNLDSATLVVFTAVRNNGIPVSPITNDRELTDARGSELYILSVAASREWAGSKKLGRQNYKTGGIRNVLFSPKYNKAGSERSIQLKGYVSVCKGFKKYRFPQDAYDHVKRKRRFFQLHDDHFVTMAKEGATDRHVYESLSGERKFRGSRQICRLEHDDQRFSIVVWTGSADDDSATFEFQFEGEDRVCYKMFNSHVHKFCGYEQPLPSLNQLEKSIRRGDPRILMDHSITNDYRIDKNAILGQGQFGVCYQCECLVDTELCCVKIIDVTRFEKHNNSKAIERFNDEIKILRMLSHLNVIALLDMYCEDHKMYLVMPLCEGGDLLERIIGQAESHLSEDLARFYVYQITQGVHYLHENGIAHRDLKPENVLMEKQDAYTRIKLCDFGFSKIIGETEFMQSMVGTPAYLAPEVVEKKTNTGGYDKSVDLWSLGVIVYVCVSGTFPFNDDDIKQMSADLLSWAQLYPNNKLWRTISEDVKIFIAHLLTLETDAESQRYTTVDCLQDKWLSTVRQEDLRRAGCLTD